MENSFENLLALYLSGELSGDRLSLFFALLEKEENQQLLARSVDEKLNDSSFLQTENTALTERAVQRLRAAMKDAESDKIPRIGSSKRFWWAAAAVLLIGLGSYFFLFNKGSEQQPIVHTPVEQDVKPPATNRALITLANGKTVYLDSAASGSLAMQQNVQIIKLDDGKIVYKAQQPTANGQQLSYNTLTNPRSSKVIDMTLADGTHVWLNAGSSVTYPVAFVGNERKVSVTGEAYFEVKHDAEKPFKVNFNSRLGEKGEITVLGTHFNVNAYDDEADSKVTLLEGSVKVNKGDKKGLLKPGEQAQVANDVKVVSNVDMEQVMAWKNGLFSFNGADIKDVMRQLARWYDLEVSYAGSAPEGRFKGEIPKDLSLSQVLNVLTTTRIHYKMEEKNRITIMPD